MEQIFGLYDNRTKTRVEVKAISIGSNEWKALSPFHKETNPSLMINDQKKVYHCLGCDKKGRLWDDKYYSKTKGKKVKVGEVGTIGAFLLRVIKQQGGKRNGTVN